MQLLLGQTKEQITCEGSPPGGILAKPAEQVTCRKRFGSFFTPKTQKALNNQGFEYGGSVEIRTLG
ncbi:TPA: hypothetical protein SMR42_001803 [Pseudomonas putida]|nr:hypothetical protein [Pseudomonas putida]